MEERKTTEHRPSDSAKETLKRILRNPNAKTVFERILAEEGYALIPIHSETHKLLNESALTIDKLLLTNEPENMLDIEAVHPEAIYGTCPACGKRLEQGDTYKRCPHCGKRVTWYIDTKKKQE